MSDALIAILIFVGVSAFVAATAWRLNRVAKRELDTEAERVIAARNAGDLGFPKPWRPPPATIRRFVLRWHILPLLLLAAGVIVLQVANESGVAKAVGMALVLAYVTLMFPRRRAIRRLWARPPS